MQLGVTGPTLSLGVALRDATPHLPFEIRTMNRVFSLVAVAAVLGTNLSLQAQTINVAVTGWTAVPVTGNAAVPFNGFTITGFVNGNSSARIGTTLSGGTTTANALFVGGNTGGVSIGGGSSAAISGTESYTLTLGAGSGHATATITVAPSPFTTIVRNGPNHRGAANSNVTMSWPGAGSISAAVQIRDLPGSGQPPILETLPVTASTGYFTTATSLTMSASADTTGTVGNGNLQMNAICDANGQVTLR